MKGFRTWSITASLLLISSPGWAQEDHAVSGGGAEHHASSGLPQFDPQWWPSQVFWLAIAFVILYAVFSRRVLPEISGVLDNRRDHIESDLTTAERLKAEAEAAQKTYETGLSDARRQATDAIGAAQNDLKIRAEQQARDFRERLETEMAALEQRLGVAKAEAMDDMTVIAAEIASESARKIVGISLDPQSAQSVVKSLNRREAA